jgi:hypothetical protein
MTSSLEKVLDWIELKQNICISLLATPRIKKTPRFHHAKKKEDGHSRRYTPRVKVVWLKWRKGTSTVPVRLKGWNSMIKQSLGMKNQLVLLENACLEYISEVMWLWMMILSFYNHGFFMSQWTSTIWFETVWQVLFLSFDFEDALDWAFPFVCMQWPLWHYWWC